MKKCKWYIYEGVLVVDEVKYCTVVGQIFRSISSQAGVQLLNVFRYPYGVSLHIQLRSGRFAEGAVCASRSVGSAGGA